MSRNVKFSWVNRYMCRWLLLSINWRNRNWHYRYILVQTFFCNSLNYLYLPVARIYVFLFILLGLLYDIFKILTFQPPPSKNWNYLTPGFATFYRFLPSIYYYWLHLCQLIITCCVLNANVVAPSIFRR